MRQINKRINVLVIFLVMLFVSGLLYFQYYQGTEVADYLKAGEKAIRVKTFETNEILRVFFVKGNDSVTKVIQQVIANGFVDTITIMVTIGVEAEEVLEVEILKHRESEDYGGYLTEEWFLQRFVGKQVGQNLTLVKMSAKNPDQVVAITGATKTSAAVLSGVNLALQNFASIKGGLEE